MRRQTGKINWLQVGLAAIAIGLGCYGYVYGPMKLRKMAMSEIARDTASRMMVVLQDAPLAEEVAKRAHDEQGVEIGPSDVILNRQATPKIVDTVTIRWTEQVKPFWSSHTQVYKMQVSQSISPDTSLLK
jgi:hypothetical protein